MPLVSLVDPSNMLLLFTEILPIGFQLPVESTLDSIIDNDNDDDDDDNDDGDDDNDDDDNDDDDNDGDDDDNDDNDDNGGDDYLVVSFHFS